MRPEIRALLGAFLLLSAACGGPRLRAPVASWEGGQARVELSYFGKALSVRAAGDFNDWNPEANPFIPGEDDEWTCVLHLAPGRYAYLLVLEDSSGPSWRIDPGNPRRTRDFLGRELSLLAVGDGAAGDKPGDAAPAKRSSR